MKERKEELLFYNKSAEELRASITALMESADGLVYSIDRNFRFIYFNNALKSLLKDVFGIDPKPGDRIKGIIKDTDREAVQSWQEVYSKAFKGEQVKVVRDFNYRGRTEYWSFCITPVRLNGTITAVVGHAHCVTDLEKVRAAIRGLGSSFARPLGKGKKTRLSIKPVHELSSVQLKRLEPLFGFVFHNWKEQLTTQNIQLVVKILELLSQYDTAGPAHLHETAGMFNPVITHFNELISRHYKKQRSVAFYANALHLHPFYLNSLVKRHTGFTAKETIIHHILTEAKAQLDSTSLTVKEVSFKMGFEHPEHFYSLFKKYERISPARYRLRKN